MTKNMRRAKPKKSFDTYPGAGSFVEMLRDYFADVRADGYKGSLEDLATGRLNDYYFGLDKSFPYEAECKKVREYLKAFPNKA